jgi:thiamine monophosphate synthase
MDFLRSRLRLSLIVDAELARRGDSGPQWDDLAHTGVTSLFFRVDGAPLTTTEAGVFQRLAETWRARGGYVFVMDDALLALRLGCHGVFLRSRANPSAQSAFQNLGSLARMREVLGAERFLGIEISSPRSLDPLHATGAELAEFVDFAGIGPVLQYGEKSAMPLGVQTARALTKLLRPVPTFWMGGIRAEDIDAFGPAFADGVAVVRPLMAAESRQTIQRLHTSLGRVLGPSPWSVGHPPADPNFHFTQLSKEERWANAVPEFPRAGHAVIQRARSLG